MMHVCKPFAQKVDRKNAIETIDFVAQTLENVHINPFKYYSRDQFYKRIDLLKKNISDSISNEALCRIIQKNIALLNDGHTQLFYPNKYWEEHVEKNGKIIPIEFEVSPTGKVVVKKCYDSTSPLVNGDVLLEINGLRMDKVIADEKDFISAESEVYLFQRLGSRMPFILWSEYNLRSDFYQVKYKREDEVFGTELQAVNYERTLKNEESNYSFRIEEGVGILTLNLMYDSDMKFKKFIKRTFKRMQDESVTNLIIDFRYNNGGDSNIGDELLSYIIHEPFKTYKRILVKKSSEMEVFYKDYFGSFTYTFIKLFLPYLKLENGEVHEFEGGEVYPRKKNFRGDVYLLTSNQTYSSADMFVRIFQNYKVGTIIGEETGGKGIDFGEIITVKIPKLDAYFDISCKEFYDVGAFENSGVLPDIKIDEVEALDLAIELIRKEKISVK
jgi:C-terminal processing protease CtpA/Prc